MVTSHQTKNRNKRVRKRDFGSQYKKGLKEYNPELSFLHYLLEVYKCGKNLKGLVKNPYVSNSYTRALLTLRDLEYSITASNLAKLCDISPKKVVTLKKLGLAKVVRTDFRNISHYVISEHGKDFLKCLDMFWTAENYSPKFYKRSIRDLRGTTTRRLIPRFLKEHRSVLEQAMGAEFDRLSSIYNNPISNPPPETINEDLNRIYGVLEQMAGS